RACLQPLLDQIEHSRRTGEVLACDAEPILRGQHLEIGIGDSHDGTKAYNLAVIAAGNGGLLGSAESGAVFAPKIDLVVSHAKRSSQIVVDDGDARTRPRNANNVGAAGGLGSLRV